MQGGELIKILKWMSVVTLLAQLALRPSGGYALIMQMLVCVGAVMVAVEAFHTGKMGVAVVFAAVAVLFNPAVPVGLSGSLFLVAATASLALFLLSLVTVRQRPQLSMASITDRTPGSESL